MKTVRISNPNYSSDFISANYKPLDWQRMSLQKTSTGYGKKIPTPYTVNFEGSERRIYSDCFSNAAFTYIMVKGAKVAVH